MTTETILTLYGMATVAIPLVLAGYLALRHMAQPVGEKHVGLLSGAAVTLALFAALALVLSTWFEAFSPVLADLGALYGIGSHGFPLIFVVDGASATCALVSTLILGVVCNFSFRYLHRDPGFVRFFVLFLVFEASVNLVILGGTLSLVIVGWELLGLSSVLLIAYFNGREGPVRNSVFALSVYKVADFGLLLSAGIWSVALHSDVIPAMSGAASVTGEAPALVVILVSVAIFAKSAQFPFSFWLPRAMEGPTPSSAVFYGALAVHAGPVLALRLDSFFADSVLWGSGLVMVGLFTAVASAICCRVRSDIKTQLAYASLTQVSLILAEIGFGWTGLAAIHMLGHAVYRTTQILSCPSIIHVSHKLHMRGAPPPVPLTSFWLRLREGEVAQSLYRMGLLGLHLTDALEHWLTGPLMRLSRRLNALEDTMCGMRPERGVWVPPPELVRVDAGAGDPRTNATHVKDPT